MPPAGNIAGALYHSLVLLRMGEIITRNILSWLKLLIKSLLLFLHPVGCFYYSINDAPSHKHPINKILSGYQQRRTVEWRVDRHFENHLRRRHQVFFFLISCDWLFSANETTERRDEEHCDLLTKLTDLCVQRYLKLRVSTVFAGSTDRAVYDVGLRPLACWDYGFESHRRHLCLSLVSVVCCQV